MNTDLYTRIETALAEIRPFLQSDGGNISLVEVTPENIVKVKLHGACISCRVNQMTLKSGVEMTIRKHVPEISHVEQV
jgi:Fe-S cluster biogenesis protein NfuA